MNFTMCSFNKCLLGSYYVMDTVPGARYIMMNKIILSSEVLKLVEETDTVNHNEKGPRVGRCTGYCGGQASEWYGGHNPERLQGVMPEQTGNEWAEVWTTVGRGVRRHHSGLKGPVKPRSNHVDLQAIQHSESARWNSGRDSNPEENKAQITKIPEGCVVRPTTSRDSWWGSGLETTLGMNLTKNIGRKFRVVRTNMRNI